MKTRIIHTKFWKDSFVAELSPLEKLVFNYYLTNERVNILHLYECSDREVMFDTGINRETLSEAKDKLYKAGKIYFYKDFVFLANADRYEDYKTEIYKKAKENLLKQTSSDVVEWYTSIIDGNIPQVSSEGLVSDQLSTGVRLDINHKQEIINHKLGKEIVKRKPETIPPKDSKHSLEPCTEEELQEIVDSLDAPPESVREVHEVFQEKRMAGELPSKIKTCYYTVKNWVRWDIKKGYIQKNEPMPMDTGPAGNPEYQLRKKLMIEVKLKREAEEDEERRRRYASP